MNLNDHSHLAENRKVRFMGLYDWMQSIVVMFLPIIFLLTFVGQTMGVQMESMSPTLHDGDRMIVRSIFYTPRRGDVIVFSLHDFRDGDALVKRVIGLGGDVIEINGDTGVVYVNGEPLTEPYISGPTHMTGNIDYPFTVPDGHVFVLGDNRRRSEDSRHRSIGTVDEREIIGQVMAVLMPFSRIGLVE